MCIWSGVSSLFRIGEDAGLPLSHRPPPQEGGGGEWGGGQAEEATGPHRPALQEPGLSSAGEHTLKCPLSQWLVHKWRYH